MSVNLEPSSQLAFQSQYSSSLLASSSLVAFARAHVVAIIPEPFTQLVKQYLRVTNPHGQPVAFKVKTTAPKVSYTNLAPPATAVIHTNPPRSNTASVQTRER